LNNEIENQKNVEPVINKKSKNGKILVALLTTILIVVGVSASLILFADNKKDEKDTNNKSNSNSNSNENVDLNGLMYPTEAILRFFMLTNFSINDRDSRNWMMNASSDLYFNTETTPNTKNCMYDEDDEMFISDDEDSFFCFQVSAGKIKEYYIKLFGPDTNYKDEEVTNSFAIYDLNTYNGTENNYYVNGEGRGYLAPPEVMTKVYDSKQEGDTLTIYLHTLISEYDMMEEGYNIYVDYTSYEDNKPVYSVEDKEGAVNSKFEEMIKAKEVGTYEYTYKKQSDGKYYFYSATWSK
jgi:hypothetical protein